MYQTAHGGAPQQGIIKNHMPHREIPTNPHKSLFSFFAVMILDAIALASNHPSLDYNLFLCIVKDTMSLNLQDILKGFEENRIYQ